MRGQHNVVEASHGALEQSPGPTFVPVRSREVGCADVFSRQREVEGETGRGQHPPIIGVESAKTGEWHVGGRRRFDEGSPVTPARSILADAGSAAVCERLGR